jgi:hypothetical protein
MEAEIRLQNIWKDEIRSVAVSDNDYRYMYPDTGFLKGR